MYDPLAVGRRSSFRAVAIQAAVSGLVAMAFLVFGAPNALAAAAGGAGMVLGNLLLTEVAFGGGIAPAGAAFARLVVGMLAKWLVVIGFLLAATVAWDLPVAPALAAAGTSLLAYLLANQSGSGATRGSV